MSSSFGFSALLTALAVFGQPALADEEVAASSGTASQSSAGAWYGTAWRHVKDTAVQGGIDLYVPFLTYHMPYAYSPALLRTYDDYPAGGGIGKGRYNKSGNWEGLAAIEFADSHGRPEYQAVYFWVPTWRPLSDDFKVGAGFAGGIAFRSDINRYMPIPGALPVGSLGYRFFAVQATFLPGFKNDGNVLFCWAKVSFY